MGFFSFLSRKKKDRALQGGSSHTEADNSANHDPAPAKHWHHTIDRLAIVTNPLATTRGTERDRTFIMSALVSLCDGIDQQAQSSEAVHNFYSALASDLRARAAAEEIFLNPTQISTLSGSDESGYAARLKSNGSEFTTLLGARLPVERATTPFHTEITSIFDSQQSATGERSLAFAIDGITYAALTVRSELR